jgi:hypothetical protein
MRTWKSIGLVASVLAIVAFGYLPFSSAQEGKNIEQMITEAKTPADHEAIAAYYDKEAQEAHKKHAEHQKMIEWYKNTPMMSKGGFRTHCDSLISLDDKTAKQYEALAKLHREMAKSAK